MNSGEGKAVYDVAFRRIPALIDGTDPDVCQIDESLTPIDTASSSSKRAGSFGPRLDSGSCNI